MSCLQINNISLDLSGRSILKDITANLNQSEMVGLIGPNGAGKSSLLKSILGLVEIKNGTIQLDQQDITELDLKDRAKQMAYAAQGAPVHWPLSVEHIIGLGRVPHMNPWQKLSEADQEIIDQVMIDTDCKHLKKRSVMTLSGGERARVLLARALATRAPYIFADEPVASLDPAHQLEMMEILRKQTHDNCGVLVVLHDLNLAQRYCDRIILLHNGTLIGQDLPEKILTDQNLADVFSVTASRWSENGNRYLVTQKLVKGRDQ